MGLGGAFGGAQGAPRGRRRRHGPPVVWRDLELFFVAFPRTLLGFKIKKKVKWKLAKRKDDLVVFGSCLAAVTAAGVQTARKRAGPGTLESHAGEKREKEKKRIN